MKILIIKLQNTVHVRNQNIMARRGVVWDPFRIRSEPECRVITRLHIHKRLI